MSARMLTIMLLLATLAVGCRMAPAGIKVEFYPLKMAGGWASEVQFKNVTDQVQVLTARNPIYTMTVFGPDGQEVFRREQPLNREEQLENILPNAHKAYTVTWPGTNQQGERVQPGAYTVKLDFNAFYQDQKLKVPDQKVQIQ